VPGYFSKQLSPGAFRKRQQRLRAAWYWFMTSAFLVAMVVGLLYLVYAKEKP
jgi:hypothetical protein